VERGKKLTISLVSGSENLYKHKRGSATGRNGCCLDGKGFFRVRNLRGFVDRNNFERFTRIALSFFALLFASLILFASLLRTSAPQYVFSPPLTSAVLIPTSSYQGILPGSTFWPTQAIRDRLWLSFTRDRVKRSDLALTLAGRRLEAAWKLMETGAVGQSVSTATKAEKYLESSLSEAYLAGQEGVDTGELLTRIAREAIKHQILLEKLRDLAPEGAKPSFSRMLDYPRNVYEGAIHGLNEKKLPAPTPPL
jgi:hypothetical protein